MCHRQWGKATMTEGTRGRKKTCCGGKCKAHVMHDDTEGMAHAPQRGS